MKLIFNLLLALALAASARAAEPSDAKTSISFRVMSWDEVIEDLKFAVDDKKSTPMLILPNGRSLFYNYEGVASQPLVFYRESKNDKGETTRIPAASVPLNTLYEHSLLMFFNQPNQPGRYAILAMDDSPKTLGPGAYSFMNFSKAPMAIRCGTATGIAPAGKSLVLDGKPADSGEITGVEIYAEQAGAPPKRAYSNRWPYDEKTRTTVFVFQVPGTDSFELKRIHEDVSIMANHTAAAAAAAKKAAAGHPTNNP